MLRSPAPLELISEGWALEVYPLPRSPPTSGGNMVVTSDPFLLRSYDRFAPWLDGALGHIRHTLLSNPSTAAPLAAPTASTAAAVTAKPPDVTAKPPDVTASPLDVTAAVGLAAVMAAAAATGCAVGAPRPVSAAIIE